MARRKTPEADPSAVPTRRGLDVRRYENRPCLKTPAGNAKQRQDAWTSFRSVVRAIKVLTRLELPITARAIADMTEELSKGWSGIVPVSDKTVLQNEMCSCVFDAWTTTTRRRFRRRTKLDIPAAWWRKSKFELIVMAATFRDKGKASEEGRLAAIRAQRAQPVPVDTLSDRLARLAVAAASIKPDDGASNAGGQG